MKSVNQLKSNSEYDMDKSNLKMCVYSTYFLADACILLLWDYFILLNTGGQAGLSYLVAREVSQGNYTFKFMLVCVSDCMGIYLF